MSQWKSIQDYLWEGLLCNETLPCTVLEEEEEKLHAHPMVHVSLFTDTGHGMHVNDCFHCPATHRCPVTK